MYYKFDISEIMEQEESKTDEAPCFGAGTLARPRVKLYFTAPCPQLGIEAGSQPGPSAGPLFTAVGLGFQCRYRAGTVGVCM
jgi:hypothetical protein